MSEKSMETRQSNLVPKLAMQKVQPLRVSLACTHLFISAIILTIAVAKFL